MTANHIPAVPDGCQWGRSCQGCPWPGCVLAGRRHSFESPKAVELRARLALCLRVFMNLSCREAAKVMGLHPETISNHARAAALRRLRDEAIRLGRDGGRSPPDLAADLLVSARTVVRSSARTRGRVGRPVQVRRARRTGEAEGLAARPEERR